VQAETGECNKEGGNGGLVWKRSRILQTIGYLGGTAW